jgi:hypothetical protein
MFSSTEHSIVPEMAPCYIVTLGRMALVQPRGILAKRVGYQGGTFVPVQATKLGFNHGDNGKGGLSSNHVAKS